MRHEELITRICAGYETADPPAGGYRRILHNGRTLAWAIPVGDCWRYNGSCSNGCQARVLFTANILDAPDHLRTGIGVGAHEREQVYVSGGSDLSVAQVRDLLQWTVDNPTLSRARRRAHVMGKDQRRYGIEVEFFGLSLRAAQDGLRALNLGPGWLVKRDPSVTRLPGDYGGGLELNTPPMTGDEGFEKLALALNMFTAAGGRVDRSCGVHVHLDANDIKVAGLKKFVKLYAANQDHIDKLLPPSRRHNTGYAQRWSPTELERFQNARSANRFARYRTVNVTSFPIRGTVEIRQHGGTLEADKIRAWVMFCLALVDTAARARDEQMLGPKQELRDLFHDINLESDAREYLSERAAQLAGRR